MKPIEMEHSEDLSHHPTRLRHAFRPQKHQQAAVFNGVTCGSSRRRERRMRDQSFINVGIRVN